MAALEKWVQDLLLGAEGIVGGIALHRHSCIEDLHSLVRAWVTAYHVVEEAEEVEACLDLPNIQIHCVYQN